MPTFSALLHLYFTTSPMYDENDTAKYILVVFCSPVWSVEFYKNN